jgi:hypothetical protein
MDTGAEKRYAPAAVRNREPVLSVLREVLPAHGMVLEIGSGSGEHTAFLAPHFPTLEWQPSDADQTTFPSIIGWAQTTMKTNPDATIHSPVQLNTCNQPWPVEQADVIMALNMIHVSPWESCEGLMAGAGRVLPTAGVLYLYGPFKQGGEHNAPSNAEFDASLRQRNPRWGVRNLEDVIALASDYGLRHDQTIAMPANNLSVVFLRPTTPPRP